MLSQIGNYDERAKQAYLEQRRMFGKWDAALDAADESYYALSTIMHSHKRHTARQSNRVLGREGQFWQHESYDHVVRNEQELQRIRRYVLQNPVKAGLVAHWEEWPWSYCKAFAADGEG